MAANSILTGSFLRRGARLALLLSVFLASRAAFAQEDALASLSPRKALETAIELHKSHTYETAAAYFARAEEGKKSLIPRELEDLAKFSSQNALALKGRQDGAAELRMAEDALKQGRTRAAGELLKSLNANQYLGVVDRQQLATLNKSWANANQAATQSEGNADAKSLLASGRVALQKGDLDAAESFAAQADKANSLIPAWLQPWNDSPAKLRRDIHSAKEKQKAAAAPAQADPDAGKSGIASFKFPSLWPFGGSSEPAKKDAATSSDRRVEEKVARHMLKDGFIFLEANDLEKARFIALKVKEKNIAFGPGEQTPDLLLHEIQRRTGGPATKSADVKPVQAKSNPTPPPSNDPRDLLRQGRMLLEKKKYDEADKVCSQAQAMQARWGLFEDNPERLRRDLQRARHAQDRDDSVKLMAEARKLFGRGNLDEAEKKAFKAKQLHGPYGVFEFGERPDHLLDEIHQRRQAKAVPGPNPRRETAKNGPSDLDMPPPVPVFLQTANKNRAIVLVREARELERNNMLLEARQKAFEARELKATFSAEEDSPEAVLSSLFARCERLIVNQLQQAAAVVGNPADAQRVEKAQANLLEARKLAQTFELDTGRIEQTAHYVGQVANGKQTLQTAAALGGAGPNDLPTGDPHQDALRRQAREKLRHAQLELAAGKTAQARKMAMDLYDPQYGIQQEVLALIRSIAAEEYNQQALQAKRTFDAGLDAFVAKDYGKAMQLFQTIDTLMLPEQYQARLRDIMATRDMQPHALAPAQYKGDKQFIKGGTIVEHKGPETPGGPGTENLLQPHQAMEQVQVQQLRVRGQEALRSASEQFKHKQQREQAIKTLNEYIGQVNAAGLDPRKAADLRRFPEQRIQQYKTFLAEEELGSLAQNSRYPVYHDEGLRQENIRKHQQDVVEKMKLVHELIKQNKLEQASVEIKKIREVDPENTSALSLDHIVTTRIAQAKHDKAMHDNANGASAWLEPALRINDVTMDNPVKFDPRRTTQRSRDGSYLHELRDPKERAIQYRLRQPISLHFKNRPLQDVINDVTAISGVQVLADVRALEESRINLDSPLTFSADNIDMKSALKLMLDRLRLTYTIEDQVLLITTPEKTKGRIERRTYPVGDLIIAVEDHPLPDIANIQKAIERSMNPAANYYNNYMAAPPYMQSPGVPVSSHSGGLGSAYAGPTSPGQDGMPGPLPKSRSKEAMAEMLKDLIQKTVAKSTWEEMGGNGSIQYFPMGMALVINQTQEVQEEIQEILKTLRKLQDLQVSVELRAVLVSETFFERIGVDFDLNIRTPTNRNEPNLINGTFVPAPFLNRTAAGLGGLISGLTPAGTLTPDLNVPIRNSTFNLTTPQFGGYQPDAGLSLGLAFLSDIQVFMFLEAVQGDRRAHIMQAPKLTVFNGQLATIQGQMFRPTVTAVFPAPLANGNVIMIPQITAMPFGLAMTVQPVVSPDRRFIRLNVTPILANGVQDPAAAILITVPNFNQGFFDGGIPQPPLANQQLNVTIQPTIANLTIANTTVNVPDGGTVLLGGFKFLAEERTEYGPPILSKIPYLSRLFRNVGWSRDGSTLIYLVTARVIMVEEEERIFLGEIPPIAGR